ncbi:transposase [Gottfriedia acidiceleris]|uniref:transposase n=1 Tax=Gottfriedia acidiceleris TaxID=371036 RepID=UPI003000C301
MAVKGSKFNKYPIELKLEAVRLYREGYASYETISKELGIRRSTQLKAWVNIPCS